MNEEEKLRKELADAKALIHWYKRQEEILRAQFAFYVQYGQDIGNTGEYPNISETK